MIVFTEQLSTEGLSYQTYPLETDQPHILVTDEHLIDRIVKHQKYASLIDGQVVIPSDEEIAAIEAEKALNAAKKSLTAIVQHYLDKAAQARNYDGILSLCTYATSSNAKFAAEGQAGVVWRDAVWSECYRLLDEVVAGARPVPTSEELIAMLPAMQWPE